ncbi:hypothetical protein EJ06DRAFT_553645 [Trichodelitschia bisporula]|uniref:Uncharacterized protein n=1 Tax=Trichodelitschia bisporula TaxID=703511 RepID=A0A6G1I9V6_9PEZI|nr:hypothetical protein EJ06DRAFT_553645 [Trichodelitschia bisporula]
MPPVRRVSTPHGKGPPQGETIQVEPKPQMTPAPDILGSIQVTVRKPVRPVIQVQQPVQTRPTVRSSLLRGGIATSDGKRDRWHIDEAGGLVDSLQPGAQSSGWI